MNKRHLFFAIITVLLTMNTVVAQVPQSFTYQAVVRNNEGRLVSNSTVGVRVSILHGSPRGTVVYSSEYTPRTNVNGLFSIVIGDSVNSISGIDWVAGPYFLKSEVDPDGGSNYSLKTAQQMLSVPYALHAHTVSKIIGGVNFEEKQKLSISHDTIYITSGNFVKLPAGFSGDYDSLINKPAIPALPTNVSAFNNDAGYLTSYTETQVLNVRNDTICITGGGFIKIPADFSGSYNDLTNKPTLFSGNYNDLTNKPTMPTIPTNLSAFANDVGYMTSVTETQVLSISHDTIYITSGNFVKLPAGFSGDYNDLTNKPTIFFGNYNDLTNKPVIPTVPSNVSAFTNDAGYFNSVTETQTLSNVATNNDSVKSQIKNLYDPTDSMDAINLRTLNAVVSRYDSIITNLLEVIDTLRKPVIPIVTTTIVSGVTAVSATAGGNVSHDGGAAVTARGVCWSTISNPTVSGNYTVDGTGVGGFSSNMTGLAPGTTYYVRAYATNSVGTAYGNEDSFTTDAVIPVVTTAVASSITYNSATSGGTVTSDGGASITARGVCWSTSHNPTTSDSHTTNGTGMGNFTSSIAGLTAGTTYYVRAYATNSVGTAYGNEESFTTDAVLPVVTTAVASNITDRSATSGGTVTSDGGATVTARGVCWSTSHNPTTSDNHTTNGTGTGNFTSSISGIAASTTYYVRAYATNSVGTAYGNEITFTTVPAGALSGVFSIGNNKQVRFSRGNLQWSATGGGSIATIHDVAGGTAAGTWRFAEHQWDVIGYSNSNISSSYTGWLDLYGWGTSGWNSGANAYQPYSTSTNYADYCPGGSYTNNITGAYANADWGVYNAISNGGNQPGLWRTLTQTEWDTLASIRNTTSGIRYAKATVNGVSGVIIVPDNWSASTHTLDSTNMSNATYSANSITATQWIVLENAGCAFLPAPGDRLGSSVDYVGLYGDYWSATYKDNDFIYSLKFGRGSLATGPYGRCVGLSVRLVQDTN